MWDICENEQSVGKAIVCNTFSPSLSSPAIPVAAHDGQAQTAVVPVFFLTAALQVVGSLPLVALFGMQDLEQQLQDAGEENGEFLRNRDKSSFFLYLQGRLKEEIFFEQK